MRYLLIFLLLAACDGGSYNSDLDNLGAYNNPVCLIWCGTTNVVTDGKGAIAPVSPNYSESSTFGN